ncbi:WSC domain-containing protein [Pseudoponticoccus marisrubri]|uniref:WSC domain-containing protein n=1 Tax=Pseudoponticoccus marisrubri TaxID=1685382 RepID=A0A0W7WIB7_9RHOB|nr:WSC domain-containing protein [Pseudoponticoccus marisrubri]KUF10247.1 hypothetical protein AVJ23_12610 [Pseudoponticoccus marisrubri]
MRSIVALLSICLVLAGPAAAEFEATAPDGRTVILSEDFTWRYKAPAPVAEGVVVDNWNRGACGMTGQAAFTLATGTEVSQLVTWYNWPAGQQSAPASFHDGRGATVLVGQIRRGACDIHQPEWCEGVFDLGRSLPAGSYSLSVTPPRICQNAGSGGQGFLRVTGRAVGSTTPPPPPAATTAGQYLGCFKDEADRDLSVFIMEGPAMSAAVCIAACAAEGYAYAGTQYASHCFCDNDYGRYGSSEACDMPCTGKADEICGGTWANSVYATGR